MEISLLTRAAANRTAQLCARSELHFIRESGKCLDSCVLLVSKKPQSGTRSVLACLIKALGLISSNRRKDNNKPHKRMSPENPFSSRGVAHVVPALTHSLCSLLLDANYQFIFKITPRWS